MNNNISSSPLIREFSAKKYSGVEFESRQDIIKLQDRLLSEHVQYAIGHSPFYRSLFEHQGLDKNAVQGIKDLAKIGFTTKTDLEKAGNDFLACPREDIVDVCLTSATTGDSPNIILQSSSDLARLAYNEEAAFNMIGINSGDTMIMCAAIDRCFMAGIAYYLGGLNTGARMVRAGSGSAAQHWQTIKTAGGTVIVGVPSLIRKIGQYAIENGEDPKKIGVRLILAIGESIRDQDLRLLPGAEQVERMWGAPLYSTYASTEMATAFCECKERKGGHLRPELMVVEIVDDQGNQVPAGKTGEVVITPLGVTGMPLLRFKTGDISFMIEGPCGCGRQTPRLGPVLGRKNQMLKLKGTTIFPSTIISVADGLDLAGAYVEASKNSDGTDRVVLYAACAPTLSVDKIADELRARMRVVPEIVSISEEELNRKVFHPGKRKKTTFFDLR